MKPLISIALCTYNGSRFVEAQIDSILRQTYEHVELIVVDDCSTDQTFEILKRLAATHPQIKLHQNSINLGFNKNFEKAIKLCSGEYIAISDQDDIWRDNKLERLIDHIKNKWLIFSNSDWMDEHENLMGRQILADDFELGDRNFKSLLFNNFVTGHTAMFSKDLLEYILPIPEQGFYDWWIGFVALYHNQITCLNECLTLHRIHSSSAMYRDKHSGNSNLKSAHIQERVTNLKLLKEYKNLTPDDREIISKIYNEYIKKNSLFLYKTLFKCYSDFFPDLKKRKGMSKLNFIIRFTGIFRNKKQNS